jgi:hypothetical protein
MTIEMSTYNKARACDLLQRILLHRVSARMCEVDHDYTDDDVISTVELLAVRIRESRDEFDVRNLSFSELADMLRFTVDRKEQVTPYGIGTYLSNANVGVEEFLWKVYGTMPTNWELCRECEHGIPTDEVCFDCE